MSLQIVQSLPPGGASADRRAGAPVALDVVAGLLRGLNREQRSAVAHGDGPLLVIAGPGTGKTEVVTRRVAWLIASKRARPREILALTFTDNAAEEMQARVDLLVPYGHADAEIATFHAFGDRLTREHVFELGLAGDVRLISRAEAIVLLREHLFALGLAKYLPLGDPTRFLGALVDLFQRAKDEGVSPEMLEAYANRTADIDDAANDVRLTRLELAHAYSAYECLLGERGLIDHGDQVSLAVSLLRDHPAVRDAVRARYRYLLVDEFQDMNNAQIELVLALGAGHRNMTVVGDPDQAIYAFRGAGTSNIARFAAAHPGLRRVVLRRNYRSRQPIIEAAQRVRGHMVSDSAVPDDQARQLAHRRSRAMAAVRSSCYGSPEEEADGVAVDVANAVAGGRRPREIAVLARSNAEAESLARSLRARGVPVQTQLPSDLFALPAVRPLLAYLRVVADPDNTLELYALATSFPYELGGAELTALLNDARRRHRSLWQLVAADPGVGPASNERFASQLRKLVDHVRAGIDLSHQRAAGELLYDYLRRSGRLARLVDSTNADEARVVARFFEIVRSRASLLRLDRVAALVPHLDSFVEASDEPADVGPFDNDAVAVLTVHRAKGLEFPIVHLTGLTDGRFPTRARARALDLPWDEIRGAPAPATDRLDEERHLFYVAMTRARDELWISHHVTGPGGRGRRRPSPFIAEALDAPSTAASAALDPLDQIGALAIGTASRPAVASGSPSRPQAGEYSFSELQDYLDCPERYRLRHVVGLPAPAHHALAYGTAVHQAVAAFHVSARRGEPLSEEELIAVYRRAWSPEGFLSREHEEARFAAGAAALRRFRKDQLAAPADVIAVERPFLFASEGLKVRGRMDRIDRTPAGDVIVDYKTSDVSEQAKADARARDSLQLQVYALAHQSHTGRLPYEVRLHFLDTGVVGGWQPEPDRLGRAVAKLQAAAFGIAKAEFAAKPNPVACGYCPYRQVCASSAA